MKIGLRGHLGVGDERYGGAIGTEAITCELILIPAAVMAVKLLEKGRVGDVKFMRANADDRPWAQAAGQSDAGSTTEPLQLKG